MGIVTIAPRNDYVWESDNDGEWVYVDPTPDHGENAHNEIIIKIAA